jgi:hypothetical protein
MPSVAEDLGGGGGEVVEGEGTGWILAKLEEQLELQGGLVKQMVDLQEQILRKLE